MNTWSRNYLVFCHVAVPLGFLALAEYSHRNPHFLTWQVVVLLGAAGLPLLLPLLAYYVKGIGKDGVLMNNVFDGTVSAPEKKEGSGAPLGAAPALSSSNQTRSLTEYSKPARKVMRTLWRFQREQFKEDFSQRWAFGVHPMALDYPQFNNGISELRFDGLIQNDGRGMVFLTDKGILFCRENADALSASGEVWDRFGSA